MIQTFLDLYFRDKYDLFAPLLRMSLHGIKQDDVLRKEIYDSLKAECLELRDSLEQYNDGKPLYKLTTKRDQAVWQALRDLGSNTLHHLIESGFTEHSDLLKKSKKKYYNPEEVQKSLDTIRDKGISDQELAKLLQGKHKLPQMLKRRANNKRTPSLDETILRKLKLRFGSRKPEVGQIIDTVMLFRRKAKQAEFMTEGLADADGRVRCTYKLTPETGRLASAKNPKGGGRNIQNIPGPARRVFIPDEGCLFLEADLSQAEDRVTKVLAYWVTGCQNDELLWRARAMPWENDEHTRTALTMYHISLEQWKSLDKADAHHKRFMAKKTNHAGNYDIHGQRLSDELLKDGVIVTAEEMQRFLDLRNKMDPEIGEWRKWVRKQVIRHRRLTNSWGAVWSVPYERLDDRLYRRAYAWQPQGEVGRITNQWGVVPLDRAIQSGHFPGAALNTQTHDSVLVSVPPNQAYGLALFLQKSLFRPRFYHGIELAIPVEFKIGMDWSFEKGQEFKRLPSHADFTEMAYALYRGEKL